MDKYEEAVEVADRAFLTSPFIGEVETKLRLISQVLVRNVVLSGMDDESQECIDAWRLIHTLNESADSLFYCNSVISEVAGEMMEILGHKVPKEQEPIH